MVQSEKVIQVQWSKMELVHRKMISTILPQKVVCYASLHLLNIDQPRELISMANYNKLLTNTQFV